MRAVNLLPRDVQQPRGGDRRLPLLVGAGGVAAVTVAAVSLWLPASGAVAEKQDELASIEAALALVPSGSTTGATRAAFVRERTDRVEAFQQALAGRIPFDRVLRDVALVLPKDVWLVGVVATAPEPAAATPPGAAAQPPASQDVTIQAATFSFDSVAKTLVRLSATPTLSRVRLTASDRVEPLAAEGEGKKPAKKQRAYLTFTIVASVPTEGSS